MLLSCAKTLFRFFVPNFFFFEDYPSPIFFFRIYSEKAERRTVRFAIVQRLLVLVVMFRCSLDAWRRGMSMKVSAVCFSLKFWECVD